MTRKSPILDAARRDNSQAFLASLFLLALCGAVLGYNWRYVYNWVAGPFELDGALLSQPGAREFVRFTGALEPTGLTQTTTLRLFKGAIENTSATAVFLAADVADRRLLVKVDPEFAGEIVEGRLQPLPETIRTELDTISMPGSRAFHPALLDAERTSYRWDFNLFVMIAAPLTPVVLLIAGFAFLQRLDVERHEALADLRRFGPVAAVVARIEEELRGRSAEDRAGPFWFTSEWLVALDPTLTIFANEDLLAAAHIRKDKKGGGSEYRLHFWRRGQSLADEVEVAGTEGEAFMAKLRERLPWIAVEDGESYQRRWRDERRRCIEEAEARRIERLP